MKITSDFDGRDVEGFLANLHEILALLDTFGQIQATVGGLSMSAKASKTFECHAMLENYLRRLEHAKTAK